MKRINISLALSDADLESIQKFHGCPVEEAVKKFVKSQLWQATVEKLEVKRYVARRAAGG